MGVLGAAAVNAVLIILLIHLQTTSSAVGAAQIPSVSVAEQQNVPLAISVEGYDVSDPSSPQIRYKVQNVGDKAIQAYTILEEIDRGGGEVPALPSSTWAEGTNFYSLCRRGLEYASCQAGAARP